MDEAVETARIWEKALNIEEVDPDDDFFADLGGHSLTATAVAAEISNALSVPLDPYQLYTTPTLRELTGRIEDIRTHLAELGRISKQDATGALAAFAAAFCEIGVLAAMEFVASDVRLRFVDESDGSERPGCGKRPFEEVLWEIRARRRPAIADRSDSRVTFRLADGSAVDMAGRSESGLLDEAEIRLRPPR